MFLADVRLLVGEIEAKFKDKFIDCPRLHRRIGRTLQFVRIAADDDAHALRIAEKLVDGHDVELWQLDRKIGVLRLEGPLTPE